MPLFIGYSPRPPFTGPESIPQGVESIFQLFFVDRQFFHLAGQLLINLTDKGTHFFDNLSALVLGVVQLAASLEKFLTQTSHSAGHFVLDRANDELCMFLLILDFALECFALPLY